jgi:hypothetical protein
MLNNRAFIQASQSERSKILEKAKTTPHLTNINMDPSLSGSIKILLEGEGRKIIGLPGKSDINLIGIGYSLFKIILFAQFKRLT